MSACLTAPVVRWDASVAPGRSVYSAAPMPFLVRAEVVAELKAAAQLLILHGSLQLAPPRGGALFKVEFAKLVRTSTKGKPCKIL